MVKLRLACLFNHRLALWVVAIQILLAVLPATSRAETIDVTGQVSVVRSGLAFNRGEQTFDTVVTLTNSLIPISGPLSVVVSSISSQAVTLANASGTTVSGRPYVDVPLSVSPLLPGQSPNPVVLKFSNPTRVAFTFEIQITAQVTPIVTADSVIAVVGPTEQNISLPGIASLLVPTGAVDTAVIEVSRAEQRLFDVALAEHPEYVDISLPRLRVKSSVELKKSVTLMATILPILNPVPVGFELLALLLFEQDYGTPSVTAVPATVCNAGTSACVELTPNAFKPIPSDPTDPIAEVMFVAVPQSPPGFSLWRVANVQPANNTISNNQDVTFEANLFISPTVSVGRQRFVTAPLGAFRVSGSFKRSRAGDTHHGNDLAVNSGTRVLAAHDGIYSRTTETDVRKIDESPNQCTNDSSAIAAIRNYVNANGLTAACTVANQGGAVPLPPLLAAANVSRTLIKCVVQCVCIPPVWKGSGIKGRVVEGNVTTNYLHLQSHSVPATTQVQRGDEVALSDNTGGTCGPHLHFDVDIRGSVVDPRPLVLDNMSKYLLPADPTDGMPRFDAPVLQVSLYIDSVHKPPAVDTLRIEHIANFLQPNDTIGGTVVSGPSALPSSLVINGNGDAEIRYRSPPRQLFARLQQEALGRTRPDGTPYTVDDLLSRHDVRLRMTLEGYRMGPGVKHVLHEWNLKGKAKLKIVLSGTGKGSVVSVPQGILCAAVTAQPDGPDCEASFNISDPVDLVAAATPGSTFLGWEGDCVAGGTMGTFGIQMDSDKNCGARFDALGATMTLDEVTERRYEFYYDGGWYSYCEKMTWFQVTLNGKRTDFGFELFAHHYVLHDGQVFPEGSSTRSDSAIYLTGHTYDLNLEQVWESIRISPVPDFVRGCYMDFPTQTQSSLTGAGGCFYGGENHFTYTFKKTGQSVSIGCTAP